jgi:hypothetical protein
MHSTSNIITQTIDKTHDIENWISTTPISNQLVNQSGDLVNVLLN